MNEKENKIYENWLAMFSTIGKKEDYQAMAWRTWDDVII